MKKTFVDWIALVLVIIGAINWGLVGLFNFDLIDVIFGAVGWLATIIYVLVALSGIYLITYLFKK